MKAPTLRLTEHRMNQTLDAKSIRQAFLDDLEIQLPADSEITVTVGPGPVVVTLSMFVTAVEAGYEPRMRHLAKVVDS